MNAGHSNGWIGAHDGAVLGFLVMVGLIVAGGSPVHAGAAEDGVPFKDAEFFIEYNATDGDTGVQMFLDDDNWRKISIATPKGKKLFSVKGKGKLGRQGLTELFFESVEPELGDLSLATFFRRFPEGDYRFHGLLNDGGELASEVEFTHVIPCNAETLPEDGSILDAGSAIEITWEEVDSVVDPDATDDAGETVCTDPENLGQELEIDAYQVIVENEDIDLIVDVTSDDRGLTIPVELLQDDTLYIYEVLTREESGNQTITERYFCTGPGLTGPDCDTLFEEH